MLEVVPVQEREPTLPRVVVGAVHKAMQFNADLRYQTAAEMFADLKNVAQHLANPEADDDGGTRASAAAVSQCTLMVVESNTALQDIFRQRLKTHGFRVLVTRDPDWALARFGDHPKPADCLLICAGELGEAALAAFNRLDDSDDTRKLPAILLLGERQADWLPRVKLAEHRLVLQMPLKVRELRETLSRLAPNWQPAVDT
jgi:CheY-like chemotaxis protein